MEMIFLRDHLMQMEMLTPALVPISTASGKSISQRSILSLRDYFLPFPIPFLIGPEEEILISPFFPTRIWHHSLMSIKTNCIILSMETIRLSRVIRHCGWFLTTMETLIRKPEDNRSVLK